MHWLPAILILPYFFILLKIFRSLLTIKPFYATANPSEFVSVVIACKNEELKLPDLLNCLASQNYPHNLFEVIIVDDNSSDNTFNIASGFKVHVNISAVHNEGKGKKQAIRTGVNASSGSLIITTDADCRMEKNWIRSIAECYEEEKPDMIICPVLIESKGGMFGRFQELEFLSLQGITAGSAISNNPTMCNGANLSFTKAAYLNNVENLHFEIPSGDDVFLLHSLKKDKNSKIFWLESSDTIVTTEASSTFISFIKQRCRWLSKGKAYKDTFTISLGIVTFITIVLELSYLIAGIFSPSLLYVLLTICSIKSVADLLILYNTSYRYRKMKLLKWFIPSLIVYPIYVLAVSGYSLILMVTEHLRSMKFISPFTAGLTCTIIMLGFLVRPDAKLSLNLVLLVFSIATGGLIYGSILLVRRISNRFYLMTVIELNKDEKLIKEGGANHIKGRCVAGGRLTLTNKRLIFKSHKNNSRIYEVSFEISKLKKVYVTKTLYVVRNGLRLELEDNTIEKFIVEEPNDWVSCIEKRNC